MKATILPEPPATQFFLLYALVGVAILAAAFLPRLLWRLPLSMPMAVVALGFVIFSLPFGLDPPTPMRHGFATEKLCEAVVIVSLMGAGLKIDRPFSWRGWSGTWRLLGITMILTIAGVAVAGWGLAGLAPASVLLLGAALAPTDPVLASEIQVGPPQSGSQHSETAGDGEPPEKEEDEFRFILTSEAGLNDAMAFPFVHAALALSISLTVGDWAMDWILRDVAYRILLGGTCGLLLGMGLGRLILSIPSRGAVATAMIGPGALAATFIIYGLTERLGGYGFLAVFVGALSIRNLRREHRFHQALHLFAEMSERLLTAVILFGLGGALAGGLLGALDWRIFAVALVTIILIRPAAGLVGLIGLGEINWRERAAISFFGVRGIGSLFYLAYAANRGHFEGEQMIWSIVAATIVASVIIHGVLASPVTSAMDRRRKILDV